MFIHVLRIALERKDNIIYYLFDWYILYREHLLSLNSACNQNATVCTRPDTSRYDSGRG